MIPHIEQHMQIEITQLPILHIFSSQPALLHISPGIFINSSNSFLIKSGKNVKMAKIPAAPKPALAVYCAPLLNAFFPFEGDAGAPPSPPPAGGVSPPDDLLGPGAI